MYKYITRNKVRFNYKGLQSVEDLWDLPVEELDKIYGKLMKEKKTENEDTLLEARSSNDKLVDIKISIIKDIFETKSQERKIRDEEIENKERKQKVLGIIERKQNAELEEMSIEDLQKMI